MATRKSRNRAVPSPEPVRALEPVDPMPDAAGEEAIDSSEVAAEAYSLYAARGYQDGDDLGDWLAAEQIVRERRRGNRDAE
jgi:hypothetical protein